MILVIDTETNGLPISYKASARDINNWPRVVQIAWATYTEDGTELDHCSYLVKPIGFEISEESTRIHGITQEHAMSEGLEIGKVLSQLNQYLPHTRLVVSHNINFDLNVLISEYYRLDWDTYILTDRNWFCTMTSSTDYCELPGGKDGGFKWPRLTQLYEKLFSEDIPGVHDALTDARACGRCFFELAKRGIIYIDALLSVEEVHAERPAFSDRQVSAEPTTVQPPPWADLRDMLTDYRIAMYDEYDSANKLADARAALEAERNRLILLAHQEGKIDGKNDPQRKMQEAVLLDEANSIYWLSRYERKAQEDYEFHKVEREIAETDISLAKAWLYGHGNPVGY